MGRILNGAKAGLLAGLAHGLISALLSFLFLSSIRGEIIANLKEALKERQIVGAEEQLFNFIITLVPIMAIVIGLLVGIIAGVIYSLIQHKLPSNNQVIKGIIYSLMLWIILSLSNITTSISVWLVVIPAIAYGIVLGLSFQKFTR
jgi:hypothetical protein